MYKFNEIQGKDINLKVDANKNIIKLIEASKKLRLLDKVIKIKVKEINPKTNVASLEIWCQNSLDLFFKKQRFNVFYIYSNVNPDWICISYD